MTVAKVFSKLNAHIYTDTDLEFSESLFTLDAIRLLYSLEFDEGGMILKEIVESQYSDGIDGFENVAVKDGEATGVFFQIISPTLTKKFRFKVTRDAVTYSAINADELAQAEDIPSFSEWLLFNADEKEKTVRPQA